MTVIAAVRDTSSDCVWLGGNSRATLGNIPGPPTDQKWARLGPWMVGLTGAGPKPEAVRSVRIENETFDDNPLSAIRVIKKAYESFDIGETEEGLKRFCGSGLLVHQKGAVWDVDDSFCLTRIPDNVLWARGSGMEMAIGAAKALEEFVSSKEEIMRRVLAIVIENDVDCPGEPVIQKFDANGNLS